MNLISISGYHLANQNQLVCVRREAGFCFICFSQVDNIKFMDFGISAGKLISNSTILKAVVQPMGYIFCTEIKIVNSGSHDISQKLRQTKCLLFHF